MGHLGLTPQSVHQLGGHIAQGRTQEQAERLREDARKVQEAGAFALVLECIPPELAREITRDLSIPTIGIGAGPDCDGQVLVSYDAFGLHDGRVPSFVKQYAHLGEAMVAGATKYIEEVRNGCFPGALAK
jgi:3-methyl-2-oxobutanoate hydroxymethyltransferase